MRSSIDAGTPLDAGVRADDPALGLEWPLPITLVSPRDQALPLAADYLG